MKLTWPSPLAAKAVEQHAELTQAANSSFSFAILKRTERKELASLFFRSGLIRPQICACGMWLSSNEHLTILLVN
ncbi:hypothetical protein ACINJI_000840 [Cronobacter dublinensis]|uniref:hypothetical protein n=1 Tax=Cronobacter dublinensis TaxID=413497 RepID=UPI0023DBDB98|nr:hypothetical protein [Cronobacter dublinensis]WEP50908.1 hypothetical protein NMY27_06875 [Cronobacter dublinensis]